MVRVLMPIKDRLKQLRTAAGFTQQALAMKAGLSISAIVQIELGRIPDPRGSTVKALARALGVTTDRLLFDEDEGEPPPAEAEPEPPPPAPPKPGRGKKGK
ncbi:MAG TPA: helix-turn-helix transcriptional regulator [Gemmataceae bacterium]|nr:helix-turn-helix transcriptional regulator [Gemmataceae bacterium]